MIRDAVAGDADAIAEFWNPIIRETTVTFAANERAPAEVAAMIADRQAQGFGFLVAETAGAVLGFATYAQFRGGNGNAACMEHTVILAPQARVRGLGRALMERIEDHARARGAHSIFAGVSGENTEGRAFHAALGYAEVATLRETGFKFGRWLDLVLMQKFLS